MDILKVGTDWAKAEAFSAKISLLLSLLFFLGALGFWLLGKTAMAKAFVWPMLVAGVLIAAVSAGLYFTNKPRIAQFEVAFGTDAKAFLQSETERTAKSQNDLGWFSKCFPLLLLQQHC